MGSEREALWDAVNEYAAACGGDTSEATVSERRMRAVVAVERAALSRTEGAAFDYDAEAAGFYRATGIMAPGKDVAGAVGEEHSREVREAAWRAWRAATLGLGRAPSDRLREAEGLAVAVTVALSNVEHTRWGAALLKMARDFLAAPARGGEGKLQCHLCDRPILHNESRVVMVTAGGSVHRSCAAKVPGSGVEDRPVPPSAADAKEE